MLPFHTPILVKALRILIPLFSLGSITPTFLPCFVLCREIFLFLRHGATGQCDVSWIQCYLRFLCVTASQVFVCWCANSQTQPYRPGSPPVMPTTWKVGGVEVTWPRRQTASTVSQPWMIHTISQTSSLRILTTTAGKPSPVLLKCS